MKKKIMFITGTRADYGKIKPLIKAIELSNNFEAYVFVCGMHVLEQYGNTYKEVEKDGYKNIYIAFGLAQTQSASVNLGNTISCLSGYVSNIKPDMIVVHGDRMDALGGAIVGVLHNIVVAHIEGGELSGTMDESIRHAVSKFAHVHFVCTQEAHDRLIQLGEEKNRIFIIGSPDVDIMLSKDLPSLSEAQKRYNISFNKYGILMYHPVTTEYEKTGANIKTVVDAVIESKKNYIVVYPNNDLGSEIIFNEYNRFNEIKRFKVFPSIRFEYFLVFLKNADFIIGNSSAGIRESGIYSIPAIDIGTRQSNRYSLKDCINIQHTEENKEQILQAIRRTNQYCKSSLSFGKGDSTERFLSIVRSKSFWSIKIQKHFIDLDF